MFDEPGAEIFTAQMRVTSLDLELEDTAVDSQKGHIESPSTEIEAEDVPLATETTLLIEAVCDGGGGRLVSDTKYVDTSDDTGILGSLTPRVFEVGRNGDDGVLDGGAQVRLCSLSHLYKNHRFRRENQKKTKISLDFIKNQ